MPSRKGLNRGAGFPAGLPIPVRTKPRPKPTRGAGFPACLQFPVRTKPRPKPTRGAGFPACLQFPVRVRRAGWKACATKAFTLIEILVVVIILSVAVGAIVPQLYNRTDERQLDSAAHILNSAFSYALSAAITEGRRYRWTWDEEARLARYTYERDPIEKPGEFVPALVGLKQNEKLPDTIELEGIYFAVSPNAEDDSEKEMPPEITFYPDGHATGAYVVLRITPPSGQEETVQDESNTVTVMLNGTTGRVRVIPGNVPLTMQEAGEESETQLQQEAS